MATNYSFQDHSLKINFMLYVSINLEMPPQCPHLTVGHSPTLKRTLLIDNSGPAWEKSSYYYKEELKQWPKYQTLFASSKEISL